MFSTAYVLGVELTPSGRYWRVRLSRPSTTVLMRYSDLFIRDVRPRDTVLIEPTKRGCAIRRVMLEMRPVLEAHHA